MLNVVGDGTCFGDWGVVNNKPRGATMVTMVSSEILEMSAMAYKATVDRSVLAKLREKTAEVAKLVETSGDGVKSDKAVNGTASHLVISLGVATTAAASVTHAQRVILCVAGAGTAAALSRVAHKGNADSMLISRRDVKAAAAEMRATAIEEADRKLCFTAAQHALRGSLV